MATARHGIFASRNFIIGMVHLRPLIGSPAHRSFEEVVEAARHDIKSLMEGGADAILIENNYDLPHRIKVLPETGAMFSALLSEVRPLIGVPLGLCVLWNDWQRALELAKQHRAQFIRIPAFVDAVRTPYGDVFPEPEAIVQARRDLQAEDVEIVADIHVKHSTLLSPTSLAESTRLALEYPISGLIITGDWTGDPPKREHLESVRRIAGAFPILVGSGATTQNARGLLEIANGLIVGTALKEGERGCKEELINLTHDSQRVSTDKVREFMRCIKDTQSEFCREIL